MDKSLVTAANGGILGTVDTPFTARLGSGGLENKMEKMLMNPDTGSVDTEENWLAEMATWETANGKTPEEQFRSLEEVVKDKEGDWIPAQ